MDKEPALKAYGYSSRVPASRGALPLTEVSFVGDPATLRQVAAFLLRSADEMERHGAAFGHEHLRDAWEGWRPGSADVIVPRADDSP